MVKSNAATVDAYLQEMPEDRRAAISTLREMILEVAPSAQEWMKYGMAYYDLDGPLFALASQKNYISLYVPPQYLTDEYRARLGKTSLGKGCIRFTRLSNLNLDAVRTMLADAVARQQAAAQR